LAETPEPDSSRVAVVLNGLGTIKYEELFVLYSHVAKLLAERGLTVIRPEVGEHITSLDMAGVSLTVVRLDEELERLWLAPADAVAFRRGVQVGGPAGEERGEIYAPGDDPIPEAQEPSRESATRILQILEDLRGQLEDWEDELGRLDAIAGDGDHGRGMVLGIRAAVGAAQRAVDGGAGARTVLVHAGAAWSAEAGGTSGALWGAVLTSLGGSFDDADAVTDRQILDGVIAGIDAVQRLGGAKVGDKTMVDAMVPAREALELSEVDDSADVDAASALTIAAERAAEAAEETEEIGATLGRARVLGDKSVGTPDPGAVSFSRILARVAELLAS
jgi:dihydroxyacetone kinase